jgi:competence protein ComER
MMKIGFIGTGSMGTILIESFLRSGAIRPEDASVSNRTYAKAAFLADRFPGLTAARSNSELVKHQDIIFLCIKPAEFKCVLDEIRSELSASQIVVSITSPVLIRHLEDQLPCKIAKVIPSITNFVHSGATLCIYGERITDEDQIILESLLTRISTPLRVSEAYTRVISDISSCGPAFLAFLVQKLIDAAAEETGIPRETAVRLACEMTLGTGQLLTNGGFTPAELQQRVTVPGGITAEGIKILQKRTSGAFHELIRATHAKYEEDLERVDTMFYGEKSKP